MLHAPYIVAFVDELTKLGRGPKYLEDMQPGDIVSIETGQTSTKKGPLHYLVGKTFEKGTQAMQGSFSHTGIYVGGGKMVEARIGEGVTLKSFGDALKHKSFLVHRPKVDKRHRIRAAKFAKQQVGKDYDSLALVVTAGGLALPEFATRLIDKNVLRSPQEADKYTCSNLVQAAYEKAHLTGVGPRTVAPVDLRRSDKMQLVKAVQKGNFEEKAPLNPRTRWGWGKRETPDKGKLIRR